jgi:hypothetical protein
LKNFGPQKCEHHGNIPIYGTCGQIGNDPFHLFSGLIGPLPPGTIRIK